MIGGTRISLAGELGQPLAAGATAIYTAQFLDENRRPIPGSDLTALVLSIVDQPSGAIVNGVDQVDILNTGRGAVDNAGNLTLNLLTGDTTLAAGIAKATRSLVFKWTYGASRVGRHQVDFPIVALSR